MCQLVLKFNLVSQFQEKDLKKLYPRKCMELKNNEKDSPSNDKLH
jgi:hypothetical protein